jgi:hypothetical protein
MSPYIFFRYAQVGGRNLLAAGVARDSVVLTSRERRWAEQGYAPPDPDMKIVEAYRKRWLVRITEQLVVVSRSSV